MAKWEDEGFTSYYKYRDHVARTEHGYPGGYSEERKARAEGRFSADDDSGREHRRATEPTEHHTAPGGREIWRVTDQFDHNEMRQAVVPGAGWLDRSEPMRVADSGANSWADQQGAALDGYTAVVKGDTVHVHYTVTSAATGASFEGDVKVSLSDWEEWDWADIEAYCLDDEADNYGRTGG